jgi:hypothetical protein
MSKSDFPYEVVDVVEVRTQGEHRLFVRFSNGREGECDLSDLVNEKGPMVEPLSSPGYFARVFIDDGVLTWPNGFDLDSVALHERMKRSGLLRSSAA